jgi:hypothetical protein
VPNAGVIDDLSSVTDLSRGLHSDCDRLTDVEAFSLSSVHYRGPPPHAVGLYHITGNEISKYSIEIRLPVTSVINHFHAD